MKTALALIIFGTALMAVAAYDTNVEAVSLKKTTNPCADLTKAIELIQNANSSKFEDWQRRSFNKATHLIYEVIDQNCRWQK